MRDHSRRAIGAPSVLIILLNGVGFEASSMWATDSGAFRFTSASRPGETSSHARKHRGRSFMAKRATNPAGTAQAKGKPGKPNILIIWGDDIGWFNVSAYNHGIMGYRTPNIDRLAQEGTM